jgi:hypothetical protein
MSEYLDSLRASRAHAVETLKALDDGLLSAGNIHHRRATLRVQIETLDALIKTEEARGAQGC